MAIATMLRATTLGKLIEHRHRISGVARNRRMLEAHAEPTLGGPVSRFHGASISLEAEEAPIVLDGRELARFAEKDKQP